jgi:protein-S-isoprenylcysteine O-methyltransferase Ste14
MPASVKPLLNRTWFTTLRAVVYALLFFSFFGWLAFSARTFDPNFAFTLPLRMVPAGLALMFAGGCLMLACVFTFVNRGRGTPAPFDAPRQFVAIGPYRYVRNPMYLGGFVLLLGLGFYLRSVSILLLTVVLLPAFHLLVVFEEEPVLKRKFGADYENYLRAVSRWLPRAPRASARLISGRFAP